MSCLCITCIPLWRNQHAECVKTGFFPTCHLAVQPVSQERKIRKLHRKKMELGGGDASSLSGREDIPIAKRCWLKNAFPLDNPIQRMKKWEGII